MIKMKAMLGIDMPESCIECPLRDQGANDRWNECIITGQDIDRYYNKRRFDCPLFEINDYLLDPPIRKG